MKKENREYHGPQGEKFTYDDFTPEQLAELKGEKGDKGETGEKGEKGEKGDVGTSNSITIGTVIKGEEAEVTITGEAPNQTLNFVLPKGDTGEVGPEGYTPRRGIDYFTQEDIEELINTIKYELNAFDIEIVSALPQEDIRNKVIYFVSKTNGKPQNLYDKYIYINGDWEHIGTTEIDLSNYYTKEEVDKKTQVSMKSTSVLFSETVLTHNLQITLPLKYQVGNNSLEIRFNNETLKLATNRDDGQYMEVGNEGELSNKIVFVRSTADGNWTLTEDIIITTIVRGVEQEVEA